jgi:Flp pilus assembly protein TadG
MLTLMKATRMADKGQPTIPGSHGRARRRVRILATEGTRKVLCLKTSRLLREAKGSQLLELALSLPIMLVLLSGLVDFGQAWNIKQKLENAAREGVRIGASAPTLEYYSSIDCSSPVASSPCSVQAIADAVTHYMVNADLQNASCLTPNSPSSSTTNTWTYTCGNGVSITIAWPYSFTSSGGTTMMATQVSLTYPYRWTLNQIIGVLPGGGSLSLPSTISASAVMQNLN